MRATARTKPMHPTTMTMSLRAHAGSSVLHQWNMGAHGLLGPEWPGVAAARLEAACEAALVGPVGRAGGRWEGGTSRQGCSEDSGSGPRVGAWSTAPTGPATGMCAVGACGGERAAAGSSADATDATGTRSSPR